MQCNTVSSVQRLLAMYAGGDDLLIKWRFATHNTPIDDGRPAQLEIRNIDNILLATLSNLEDGINTVYAALGTTAEAVEALWNHGYRPSEFRVRRVGESFEIRHTG